MVEKTEPSKSKFGARSTALEVIADHNLKGLEAIVTAVHRVSVWKLPGPWQQRVHG